MYIIIYIIIINIKYNIKIMYIIIIIAWTSWKCLLWEMYPQHLSPYLMELDELLAKIILYLIYNYGLDVMEIPIVGDVSLV